MRYIAVLLVLLCGAVLALAPGQVTSVLQPQPRTEVPDYQTDYAVGVPQPPHSGTDAVNYSIEWTLNLTQSIYCVGVTQVQDSLMWVSAGKTALKIYIYNIANPAHPYRGYFNQTGGPSNWGIRDMEYYPTEDVVFAGFDGNRFHRYNATTHAILNTYTVSGGPGTCRNMGIWPDDSLMTGDWSPNEAKKMSRTGTNCHTIGSISISPYGCTYDANQNCWWYTDGSSGPIHKMAHPGLTELDNFKPTGWGTGGGASMWLDDTFLLALNQTSPDQVMCIRLRFSIDDVGMTDIERPTLFGDFPETFQPRAQITNIGPDPQNNFDVNCKIWNKTSTLIYDQDVTITTALPGGSTRWLDFPAWTNPPEDVDYKVTFRSLLPGDEDPTNDAITINAFPVDDTLECKWDNLNPASPTNGYGWNPGYGRGWLHAFPNYWGQIEIFRTRHALYPTSTPNTCQMEIRNNGGSGGSPGSVLYNSGTISGALGTWIDHTLTTPITYTASRFYVEWVQLNFPPPPYLSIDAAKNSPSWAQWDENPPGTFVPGSVLPSDPGIRCFITKSAPTHDVGATGITVPTNAGVYNYGQAIIPTGLISNFTVTAEPSVPVHFRILDWTGAEVYENSQSTSLNPNESDKPLPFTGVSLSFPGGTYTAKCSTELATDVTPGNNRYSHTFTILPPAPTVAVTAPNGGEVWAVGTHEDITWTSTNSTTDSICYSTDNGTSWTFVAKQSPPTHTYDWTIPNTPSAVCLVKVSAIGSSTVEDQSDAVFTIQTPPAPTVAVTAPNGGEVWTVGTHEDITWTSTNSTTDSICYSTDNGTSWTFVAKQSPPTHTYDWTIPNTPSAVCLVKVSAIGSSTVEDQSDAVFTIWASGVVHDVGVTAVLRPPSVVGLGAVVYPRMTVYNYGDVTEGPFDVRCIITQDGNPTPVFDEAEPVPSLASGASVDFEFTVNSWTAGPAGDFHVRCTTELAGDMVPVNDKKEHDFTVLATLHDVGATAILAPLGTVRENTAVYPKMTVENFGTEAEGPFNVRCIITKDGNPTPVFDHFEEITSLASGASVDFEFTVNSWLATPQGNFHVCCTTELDIDMVSSNDMSEQDFVVGPSWPSGWKEVKPMPLPPSQKPVKRGGWLAFNQGNGLVYAAKGYKTTDFYRYEPIGDSWTELTGMPYQTHTNPKWARKVPRKGSKGVSDGNQYIYVTQGNNTLGFWRYNVTNGSWGILPDVPIGPYRKKVKGGTDLAFVPGGEDGDDYVYLLKGYKTEFYRFNVATSKWDTLPETPPGVRAKWDKGSWLVFNGADGTDDAKLLYAHKAKYYTGTDHEMWKYNIAGDSWSDNKLKGMPLWGLHSGRTKKKKSKDGGSGAWYESEIYALKGGNTQQFFKYTVVKDSWTELDTVPNYTPTTGRKRRVKYGADIVSYGYGAFFALKGNKTVEMWRYMIPTGPVMGLARSGVMASGQRLAVSGLLIAPNPLASGFATLRYTLPNAGPAHISIFDVAGRVVEQRTVLASRSGAVSLDLRKLSTGVYLVRFDANDFTATHKLVVQH